MSQPARITTRALVATRFCTPHTQKGTHQRGHGLHNTGGTQGCDRDTGGGVHKVPRLEALHLAHQQTHLLGQVLRLQTATNKQQTSNTGEYKSK